MKRVVNLIPYRYEKGELLVFLQKRTEDAPAAPGFWGLFGGSVELGEDIASAVVRETKEELDFVPKTHKLFKHYDFPKQEKNVFVMEVGDEFEKEIRVLEGQYGKFLRLEDILAEPKMEGDDKTILGDFFRAIDNLG